MKKSRKAALIVSAALIVLGGVLFVSAAAFTGFDFSVLEMSSLTRKEYEVNGSFKDISIDAKDCAVRLRYSEDGKCRVVCGENENITHTVEVKDNVLNITRNDSRKWYMKNWKSIPAIAEIQLSSTTHSNCPNKTVCLQ